jgi:hypothetical protein
MSLRVRTVKGFVNSYLRSERKLVTDLLRTGRLTPEEWEEIARKFEEPAEEYENGDITAEEFLERRREIEKELRNGREEKQQGVPREEAFELYSDHRDRHEQLLEVAYMDTGKSTLHFLFKIPALRVRRMLSSLRYT